MRQCLRIQAEFHKSFGFFHVKGRHSQRNIALKKLYDMYPDDYDITLAMSSLHMKKAERLMELGLYVMVSNVASASL